MKIDSYLYCISCKEYVLCHNNKRYLSGEEQEELSYFLEGHSRHLLVVLDESEELERYLHEKRTEF